jgi:hypothetical protein
MAAGYGNRAGAACGSLPVSVAFDHDANDDRVLRRSRKRDPPSPSLFLGGARAAHFWPDRDLAVAVRYVSGDRPANDPARMTPNCLIMPIAPP